MRTQTRDVNVSLQQLVKDYRSPAIMAGQGSEQPETGPAADCKKYEIYLRRKGGMPSQDEMRYLMLLRQKANELQ